MSNLDGEMLVGRVGFGESFQACPANYSAEDSMAASIVRLECEADELRAEVAMLREQARILARERDEARAMIKERDEAREALRAVYSAGCELKRHVTACVMNYREVASPSAVETLEQFHNASRDLARIVGEEAAK